MLLVQDDATLVSTGEREPLITTDYMDAVMRTRAKESLISNP